MLHPAKAVELRFVDFSVPVGVAMIGLGYSLWRDQRTPAVRPVTGSGAPQLDPAAAA
jgi:hypothetical protein